MSRLRLALKEKKQVVVCEMVPLKKISIFLNANNSDYQLNKVALAA